MATVLLTIAVIISSIFSLFLYLAPSQYIPQKKKAEKDESVSSATVNEDCSVLVVVLGDIGRSPRMQYHALSIAKHGGTVQLVGYLDTQPLPKLQKHPRVNIVPLSPSPPSLQTSNKLLFLAYAPLKVLLQTWNLWNVLGYQTNAARWMLVQNPPSIPTLAIAAAICFFRATKLVIDWHNFGYSILALKLGDQHPLISISKTYEKSLAKAATANFTVTDAMNRVVKSGFLPVGDVLTLHDRPADLYQPLGESERIGFLQRFPLLTEHFNAIITKRARLVVSSTSWTADEDFSLFLEALCSYSTSATSSHPQLPELVVVITGKGPQQTHFIREIENLRDCGSLEMITIFTTWLSFDDYALLLGSADLGVSLHTSSSGVDLPMKVVDMFGAGLPVLGWSKFTAWSELVTEGVNGRGFQSPEEMANILREVFDPENKSLSILKDGARLQSSRRWDDEWDAVAGRLFGLMK